MSSLLRNYYKQLEFIAKIKNKRVRDGILRQMSDDDKFFNVIREIVENTVKKNIPMKKKEKRLLKKHKRILLQFIKPSIPSKHKKRLVVQSGGFLPILFPILASFLGSKLL